VSVLFFSEAVRFRPVDSSVAVTISWSLETPGFLFCDELKFYVARLEI
jgi:hypothetical protein